MSDHGGHGGGGGGGGKDSFMILLIIAVVLIVIFMLIGTILTPTGSTSGESLTEFELGTVGLGTDFAARTISLGDLRIGQKQEELVKEVIAINIQSGLGGSTREHFTVRVNPAYLEEKRGVRITFSVLQANPIGNMRITWNGKEFYSAKPSGLTDIQIGKDYLKEENILEVWADGPGVFFWANTEYQVTNFRVFAQYGPQKVIPFELLPSELQTFDRGEVEFFGSGNGRLDVKVNGLGVYSRVPAGPEKVIFNLSTAPLKAGSNVISFSSTDSTTMSGAIFTIYSTRNELVKLRSFRLEEEEMKQLEQGLRGKISFTVDKIVKPGVLDITLNSQHLTIQTVREGENAVYFVKNDVDEGENTLSFAGSGAWDISKVVISLDRAPA